MARAPASRRPDDPSRRRRVVAALLTLGLSARVPRAEVQTSRRLARVGVLSAGTLPGVKERMALISGSLRELGWFEGRDLVFEVRAGGSDPARMATLADELVGMKVDLLVTSSTPAALAAKAATRSIPIVFSMVSDPVASGLVASLARPGGNLTGWSNILPETSAKLLELLRELVPSLKRVAVLYDANNQGKLFDLEEVRRAARAVDVRPWGLRSPSDIATAFAELARDRPDAMIVLQDGVTFPNREEVVRLAARHGIPAAYQLRDYVSAGGLLSYGLDLVRQNQRTAAYVDRILRGAHPGDLPVRVSGILCVRHSMTNRSMYAKQEDDEGGCGRSGGDAVDSQGAH